MKMRRSGPISLVFSVMLIAVLMACAPQPEYPASSVQSGMEVSGFVPANPEYIIDLGGKSHKIEIYRQSSKLFYAIDPDGGKVFEADEVKAVTDKLTQEGYSIGNIEFHPQNATKPSIMFVYLHSSGGLTFDNDKEEVFILLEDFLGE